MWPISNRKNKKSFLFFTALCRCVCEARKSLSL
jgi:hypothetical protein